MHYCCVYYTDLLHPCWCWRRWLCCPLPPASIINIHKQYPIITFEFNISLSPRPLSLSLSLSLSLCQLTAASLLLLLRGPHLLRSLFSLLLTAGVAAAMNMANDSSTLSGVISMMPIVSYGWNLTPMMIVNNLNGAQLHVNLIYAQAESLLLIL